MATKESKFRNVEKRCVVVLGKSGAGKSTVANMLIGYDLMSKESPKFEVSDKVLASVTRDVTKESCEFVENNTLYKLTMIDTVGLFDTNADGNEIIFDKIEEYFNNHIIEGVHLILFLFRKHRFTKEEQEVFSFIGSRFRKEIIPISALVVTGCEQDTPEVRQKFVEEFRSDPQTKDIADQMKLGIHPVGFPPVKRMIPALQQAYKQPIEDDRKALIDLIVHCKREHLTKDMFETKVKPVVKHAWLKNLPCTIL